MKTSKILDKISKLVSHADSAEEFGNKAEAKAFRATVRGLCKKHKVKIADVRRYGERYSPISTEIIDPGPRELTKWEVMIFSAITTLKSSRGLILDNGGLSVAGRLIPRREAIRLFQKLHTAADELSNEFVDRTRPAFVMNGVGYQPYADTGLAFRLCPDATDEERKVSFAIGFAEVITQQVLNMIRQREYEDKPAAPKVVKSKIVPLRPTDLVYVGRPVKPELEEVDEYVAERTRTMPPPPAAAPQQYELPPEEQPINVHGDSFDEGCKAALQFEWS